LNALISGKLDEKNLLFNVIKQFASDKIDLSPSNIDTIKPDCTFEKDGFQKQKFYYMPAYPPFKVE
jgi:hypothetical protein